MIKKKHENSLSPESNGISNKQNNILKQNIIKSQKREKKKTKIYKEILKNYQLSLSKFIAVEFC